MFSHVTITKCEILTVDLTSYFPYLSHYANMSVQYTANFNGCKKDNFQFKFLDFFLIFAQNIDCGYTLEPPH